MLRDLARKLQTQYRVADRLQLVEVMPDGITLMTKFGSLVQVLRVQGKNYSGVSTAEIQSLFDKRSAFFKNVQNDVSLSVFTIRKKIDRSSEAHEHKNEWADLVASKYNESFKEIYRTQIYVVIRKTLSQEVTNKFGLNSRNMAREIGLVNQSLRDLDNRRAEIKAMLVDYQPEELQHGMLEDTLLDFWSFLINGGHDMPGPRQDQYLDRLLACSSLEFDEAKGIITINNSDGTRYASVLGINTYPQDTHESLLDQLMQVRHAFTIVQHVTPLNQEQVKGDIKKLQNEMVSAQSTSMGAVFMSGRIDELEGAGNLVDNGTIQFVDHALSLIVYGDSLNDLDSGLTKIKSALAHQGVNIVRETFNLEAAFWSQFPDNEFLNDARNYRVTTDNVTDFINFSTSYEGLDRCAFGNHGVMMFKTMEETQFNFTFHASPSPDAAGHTILIGPTGGGKSVLAMSLIMNCLSYIDPNFGNPFTALIFDSGQGLRIPVRAFGGDYINAGNPSNLQINPLQLPRSPENEAFLVEWLTMLAGGSDAITEHHKDLIKEAIHENYTTLKSTSERSISALSSIFQLRENSKDRNTLNTKLDKWTYRMDESSGEWKENGPLSHIFNGKSDSLQFQKRLVAFDMATILKNKELLGPMTAYIFHAFHNHISRAHGPHLTFVDEMQQYLSNPTFGPYVVKMARESRKRNGVLFGAIQEPGILLDDPNGEALSQNVMTYIVMKNGAAKDEQYEKLGFNEREIAWIKKAGTGQRQVMVKRSLASGQSGSVILNIDMKSIGKLIHLFSGNHADSLNGEALYSRYGQGWVEEYLKTKKD